jgi:iron complex outermembrane recepter protein
MKIVRIISGFEHLSLIFLLILLVPSTLVADNNSVMQLETITVFATRIDEKQSKLPFAVGTVGKQEIQRGRQQLGLDETLVNIPGLFLQNRYNFAQDLRISIRGFGARSSFGIRGIKIYVDDIPQTLPDGQSNVDAIDLGSTSRIEVIRSPVSSIFGAASGGVINITTEDPLEQSFVSTRTNFGSYDFKQQQLKFGGQTDNLDYLINGSSTRLDGYRDHAKVRSSLINTKFRYYLSEDSDLTILFNAVDSPKAQDPGALTSNEVKSDRKQAAPRNLLYNAGEKLNQETIGLSYTKEFNSNHKFKLRNYYVNRDFENKLPFDINSNGQGGSVNLDRFFWGGGANYTLSGNLLGKSNRLILGLDIDEQRDHRMRFVNNQGVLGDKTTDQDEDVSSYGFYVQDVWEIAKKVTLTIAGRYDEVHYDVSDQTAGNGSGKISFYELSPIVGLNWSIKPAINVYANIAQSFDPPTTTELANPSGASGFNSQLKPQTAINYEIGVKGMMPARLRYELALFHIDVDDELIRYELEGSGQSFFENAGSSTHNGLEAALSMEIIPGLTSTLAYTYSDFTYDPFADRNGNYFDNNKIPGTPDNQLNFGISYQHRRGFYANWDVLYNSGFYADNANTVKSDSYTTTNFRAGYTQQVKHWEISSFIGINNLFDEEYFNNIRLNANFGRYFEPGPERNYYGGISLRYRFTQ